MNNPLNGLGFHQMQFAPIPDDDDDLSQMIHNDTTDHDDNWQLHEDIDPSKLEAFWDQAVNEIENNDQGGPAAG